MALNTASPYNNQRDTIGDLEVQGKGKNKGYSVGIAPVEEPGNIPTVEENGDNNAMTIARDAYRTAYDWFTASTRPDIERNISHFQGRHAPGSKYFSNQYKNRAKGFRPKTRTIVRKNEAMGATAFFATRNVTEIRAENPANIVDRVSAEINSEILEYRFKHTLNWFLTVQGAYQDTMVAGVVISHQYWKYEEQIHRVPVYDERGEAVIDNETGEPAMDEEITVIHDTPAIELRPIENVLFSPNASWLDPLGTSPFIIDRIPMAVIDVFSMIQQDSTKSEIPWKPGITKEMLLQGRSENDTDDTVRRQRQRSRLDPAEETTYLNTDYDTIWIHRNIIKQDGRDYIYYTLSTFYLLSDPIPLEQAYKWLKPGERPYKMGFSTLEAHKNYPQSLVTLVSGLQQQANELSNQRTDNVALTLNRRYFVKRGQGIDLKSLQRNVPGGVTLMNNVDGDIRVEAPPDVTSSSYEEQDRINTDFDDIAGNFSSSSVATNRKLNETVGGMEMLSGDADAITEYQLRVFTETWVEPVIKQLIQMEQRHETDPAIFAMVGEKMELWKRFGISEIQDDMIQGNMTVEVNVGFGATNPSQRINRLAQALQTIGAFAPDMAKRINQDEVGKEVFAALGYRGPDRFIIPENPEEEQPQDQPDPQIVLEQIRQQGQKDLEMMKFENSKFLENLNTQNDIRKEDIELQKDMSEKASDLEKFQTELSVRMKESEDKKAQSSEQAKAKLAERAITERNANARFAAEMEVKRTHGTGI